MPSWFKWTISILIGLAIIVVGFRWSNILLTTFFILNCIVLMTVVLLQSGKAADLAGAFGGAGSQTAFGPRGAASLLSLATTWCSVMFMVCAFAMVLRTDKGVEQSGGSVLQNISRPAPQKAPASVPVTPKPATPTPAPQSSAPSPTQPPPAQPKKP